ncbi:MAG: molybdopterin oxidoreductase family protein, partial [Methylocystaceae bacterium]
GTDHVLSAANLALLTGNLGKPGAGVNPLRGQNNVQGACDMGALPDVYTAYQKVDNEELRAKFEKAWGTTLPTKPGLKLTEAIDKAHHGDLKALLVIGENPLVSDPDIHHLEAALDNLEFLMVSDIFLTETAQKADVVFPAACFAEKDGTFSNTERRVQRVRQAITAPGEARPDWQLMSELATRLGYPMQYNNAEEIFEELRALTPSYAGINYQRLDGSGIQWPCPNEDHPGTPVMHREKFTRGLGLFNPVEYKGPAEKPDTEYPYYLTTGRTLFHYHTGTMTRRSKALDQHYPEGLIEISPVLAARMNLQNGEKAKLSTRRGSVEAAIHISDNLPDELIFMTFHFAEAAANLLTNAVYDPVAKIPEYKVSAARLEKI